MYKSGTGTRGQGHRDACVGTWGRETRYSRTLSMGRGVELDGDAGTSNTGTRGSQVQGRKGTRDGILDPRGILFEYLKQERVSWRAKVIFNSF